VKVENLWRNPGFFHQEIEVRKMRYTYFPGCSLKGIGKAYEESFLAVFEALGVEVEEMEDWNCCGATAYMSIDEMKAFALASRNLALAERNGDDLLAPCSGCYLVLEKTKSTIGEYPKIEEIVTRSLKNAGLSYKGKVKVRHPLDVLVNDIGLDVIAQKVKEPLHDVKVAPYYGCQIVRPYGAFDHHVYPNTMDQLLQVLGATIVPYPLKTRCCGGSLSGTLPETGLRLAYILLNEAQKSGADIIATPCPLCHFNLDSYQGEISKKYGEVNIPTVYFTQLLGAALGIPREDLGLNRNIVPVWDPITRRKLTHV
jgi:heterodisulfide reductase subunit B